MQILLLQNPFLVCGQNYHHLLNQYKPELANYCQPDLNIVLFGIPESDFDTNYRIIVTVQKYILDSKRFER